MQTVVDERQASTATLVDPEPSQLPDQISRGGPIESPQAERVVSDPEILPSGPAAILSTSHAVAELFSAFAKAQGEYGAVEKTLKAKVDSRRTGVNYEYGYETLADILDAVRAPNAKNGLGVMQFPVRKGRVLLIRTLLTHASGQWMSSDITVDLAETGPQAIGSGISYMRRYALKSILGLAATDDDDDGSAASTPARREQPKPAQRTSATTLSERVGVILSVDLVDEKSGAYVIETTADFKCSTKNKDVVMVAQASKNSGTTVTLYTRPSSDPSKFYPILEKITYATSAK